MLLNYLKDFRSGKSYLSEPIILSPEISSSVVGSVLLFLAESLSILEMISNPKIRTFFPKDFCEFLFFMFSILGEKLNVC